MFDRLRPLVYATGIYLYMAYIDTQTYIGIYVSWCSAYTNAYAVCESEAKIGLDVCVGASEVNGIPMPPSHVNDRVLVLVTRSK